MKPDTLARAKEIIAEIQADCENDVQKMEGKPFTGAEVAAIIGETLGLIHGLAGVVEKLLEEFPDAGD